VRLEGLLAGVLHYGTWLACAVIALGLAVSSNGHIVAAGIALLILLPVLRVALMLAVFLRQRDYRFSAIAALVLMIIFLGFALGLTLRGRRETASTSSTQHSGRGDFRGLLVFLAGE
jgi:uncharacterized membrane protein